MAITMTIWCRLLVACVLVYSCGAFKYYVGFDAVYRPFIENRPNTSIIGAPTQVMNIGGLINGIKVYMVNTHDCIRLQVWRPPPSTPIATTPSSRGPSNTTPPYAPKGLTYWLLAEQTKNCIPTKIANDTYTYELSSLDILRVEKDDVIGLTSYSNNPVVYDKNNLTCYSWQHSQRSVDHSAFLNEGSIYGFDTLPACRVYSLHATVVQKECFKLTPIMLAQNMSHFSITGTHEDACWIMEPLRVINQPPEVIYLKYMELTLPDCNVGYVEIREGRSSTSPLIQRDCSMPSGLRTALRPITSGSVYIRFWRNKVAGAVVTMMLQYSTKQKMCLPVLVGEKPIFIASPNYPNHYPPNSDICWTLTAPIDKKVRVELSSGMIDLQPPVGCHGTKGYRACTERHCKDFIEVKDDTSLLTKWCDHTGQDLIETSSAQVMMIKFVSDGSIQGTGFQLKTFAVYPDTAQCTHYLALFEAAPLQSPYYPYSYPPNRDDCWSVRANDQKMRLLLNVLDSDLEPDLLCRIDYLEVRDGATSTSPLIRQWCGKTKPTAMLTSAGYLHIRFVSDANRHYRGFSLTYTQVSSDTCTTYYAYSHREYLKPDYEQKATGYDIRCWVLRTETGKLRVKWDSLGPSTKTTLCGNTYIELMDGDSMSASSLGKFCTDSPIPPNGIDSTGSAIYVRWVSDVNSRPANFRLVYTALSSNHCPLAKVGNEWPVQYLQNYLPGMSTTAFPPFFRSTKPPTNRPVPVVSCKSCKYGPNQQRCWTIEANEDYTSLHIMIRFLELQGKDDRGQCKYDNIELRDGNSAGSPLIASLCGSVSSRNFTTTGRWLFVSFRSDDQIELRGFLIEVRGAGKTKKCEALTAYQYNHIIKSPVTSLYPAHTWKCWTITSPSNRKLIKLSARYITLASDDFIDIYDGSSIDDTLIRQLNIASTHGETVLSSSNSMTLVLRTGASVTSRGKFELLYSWSSRDICTYVSVEKESTYIMTNNFGSSNYSKNDYACWILTALEPSHTLEITAVAFILEDGIRCSADYLDIYEGPRKNMAQLLHRWCGEMNNKVLGRSSSRSLYIVFTANDRRQFPGFKLKLVSKPQVVPSWGDNAGGGGSSSPEKQSTSSLPVIIACVFAVIIIIILIVAIFTWNRKRKVVLAAAAAASVPQPTPAPVPVVVYTHPPAYRPPSLLLGAVGLDIPIDERKVAPPASEEVSPNPPASPTTPPLTTTDTATLL